MPPPLPASMARQNGIAPHSQGSTLDELHENLREVITMLMVDGEPAMESQFVGTQMLQVS